MPELWLISIIWSTSREVMPPVRVAPKSTAVFRRWLFALAGPVAVTNARVSWSKHLPLSAQKKNAKPMLNDARPGRGRTRCDAWNRTVTLSHG